MFILNKKQVIKLNDKKLLLERRIDRLCSKLDLDKDYKHILVYLDMNIGKDSPAYEEWIKLRKEIIKFDEDVSAALHKINDTGLSLPKQFIL